ncbi:cycloartenol synthase [Thraustotheca clavata]|uniref:Terpene cyclase/mutase family member n=1 Tax=Thraustotheca clavata TaxID=74557 RepID=A0A1W0A7H9_9STRA|nr:cycloartenol synthase [Thraustotheca clavata]
MSRAVPPGIPEEVVRVLEIFFDSGIFPIIMVSLFIYKLLPTTDPVLSLEQVKRKVPKFEKRQYAYKTDLKCIVGSTTGPDGKTKLTGDTECGRQVWRPQGEVIELPPFSAAENPNSADILFRQLMLKDKKVKTPTKPTSSNVEESMLKAIDFYQLLQSEDGSWQGDYGGPMFLLPGLVVTCYITGHDLGKSIKEGMIVYLRNHQQIDGGWGMHIEEASTMFGTVMNYVALRLLGVPASDNVCKDARAFILRHGGASLTPSWGKFWLACLNVYDWRGVDSLPPEMWCLPSWFPFHPGRTWVHCRMVYLPMSYLYGKRFQAKLTPLTMEIREEIYMTPYAQVSWSKARGAYYPLDEYHPPSFLIRFLNYALSWYEMLPNFTAFRRKGLEYAFECIQADDVTSNYCSIGPVNKVMNMLSVWATEGESENFVKHQQRLEDYIWVAEDGVKMAGYIGSQTWDTSFAIQGFFEAGIGMRQENKDMVVKAYNYFKHAQNKYEVENAKYWWRSEQKGGWGFGPAANGYPVTDCTGEALKSMMLIEEFAGDWIDDKAPFERYQEAVDFMLALQNDDGGFPTYEKSRGYEWYEYLNPAVVFGGIMIDYSYIECTSTSMSALVKFSKKYPTYRPEKIRRAVKRAETYIRNQQYQSGAFFGKWGVCFNYGTWFAVVGLRAAGATEDDEDVRDAVKFLCSKQREDGGWSECFFGCVSKMYLEADESQVVSTSWALLALMRGIERKDQEQIGFEKEWEVVRKGIKFLMSKQQPNGDWLQERISGVFNRSCAITYTAFRNVFPFWALGLYHKLQPGKSI